MKSISLTQQAQIKNLLADGLSTRQIEQQTGASRSTVSRLRVSSLPDQETSTGGRPRKFHLHLNAERAD